MKRVQDRMDRVCQCGHGLGEHAADAPHECLKPHDDRSLCLRFRPRPGRPPGGAS
jgi:hypothetical protein